MHDWRDDVNNAWPQCDIRRLPDNENVFDKAIDAEFISRFILKHHFTPMHDWRDNVNNAWPQCNIWRLPDNENVFDKAIDTEFISRFILKHHFTPMHDWRDDVNNAWLQCDIRRLPDDKNVFDEAIDTEIMSRFILKHHLPPTHYWRDNVKKLQPIYKRRCFRHSCKNAIPWCNSRDIFIKWAMLGLYPTSSFDTIFWGCVMTSRGVLLVTQSQEL